MVEYQRTGKRLRFNHSNAIPRYIISYAVETTQRIDSVSGMARSRTFKEGTAITCRLVGTTPTAVKLHKIKRVEQLWELIDKFTAPNYTTWLVSYRCLSDLVVSGLTEQFEQGQLTIDWPRSNRKREDNNDANPHAKSLCIIDDPPIILACLRSRTQGRIVFVDLANWFPVAENELPRCSVSEANDGHNTDVPESKPGQYSQRISATVLNTFVELIGWVKSNELGMFRYTAASQAMAAFRHRFMEYSILLHDSADVKSLERSSYFGGRTEVFCLGKILRTVHQLDVNSLFPSIMLDGMFPRIMLRYHLTKEWSRELPEIDWKSSVAEVLLETDDAVFPLKTNDLIIYPTGSFTTVLCGQELRYAAAKGYVKAVRSYAEYETAPLFNLYVRTLWGMRKEYKEQGNKLYEQFTKRLLNSLYGKFGQRSAPWQNCPESMSILPWSRWVHRNLATAEVTEYRTFGWQLQSKSPREEIEGTFPAISAFVTSAARMRMNAIRHTAGARNCLYQGVDSVVVNDEGLEKLQNAGEVSESLLGKLRLQLSTNVGEILGCSDYRLDNKIVISGRSLELETLANGDTLQRRAEIDRYLFSGKASSVVHEVLEPWQRVKGYGKGVVGQDGWVTPFTSTTPVL